MSPPVAGFARIQPHPCRSWIRQNSAARRHCWILANPATPTSLPRLNSGESSYGPA